MISAEVIDDSGTGINAHMYEKNDKQLFVNLWHTNHALIVIISIIMTLFGNSALSTLQNEN